MIRRRPSRITKLGLLLCGVVVAVVAGSVTLGSDVPSAPGSSLSADASSGASGVPPSPSPLRSDQVAHRPTEVFGFLPYWSMADWTDSYLRYDLLTTIAFFGVGVRQAGSLVLSGAGLDALGSANGATIIQHAHAAGVRAVITFESFGATRNHAFLHQ